MNSSVKMEKQEKLEWIYKGANSLVEREEYLLGRKVDKTLEQLNEEEKKKTFVLPTPKNHVEHECIPPSIRDFNNIGQAEQVDMSAKLQEDPLITIKKREEEARRQFLQNPVQLKKLQEALKIQGKKKKQKNSNKLDKQIAKKINLIKSNYSFSNISKNEKKKAKEQILDTILMHKFNVLKDKLTQADLDDIINGKITSDSSSEEQKEYKQDSEMEDETITRKSKRSKSPEKNKLYGHYKSKKESRKQKSHRLDSTPKDNKGKDIKEQTMFKEDHRQKQWLKSRDKEGKGNKILKKESNEENNISNKTWNKINLDHNKAKLRKRLRSNKEADRIFIKQNEGDLDDSEIKEINKRKLKYNESEKIRTNDTKKIRKSDSNTSDEKNNLKLRREQSNLDKSADSDQELNLIILNKLKSIRDDINFDFEEPNIDKKKVLPEKPLRFQNTNNSPYLDDKNKSDIPKKSREDDRHNSYDSDLQNYEKKKIFGLVSAEGKQIILKHETHRKIDHKTGKNNKIQVKPEQKLKSAKKLTEKEKDKIRKEMMINATVRDNEREANVKKYKEQEKKEELNTKSKYNKELLHNKLIKAARVSTVEERIKSNVNNIQRSSRHMDSHFSKR